MKKYKIAEDGSVWNKWDLHLHTPKTILSDAYTAQASEDVWEKYIDIIEKSDVRVFGITDYFSIKNYERFIELFKRKYPMSDKIFFPNIEFRLEASVNKGGEEVNLHIIFSNEILVSKISDFLEHMPTNIIRNGSYVFCSKLTNNDIGVAAIDHKKLREVLKQVFGNETSYLIGAAANNQGLRPDTSSPRKINISDDIERVCDFIFGGAQNKDYYLRIDRYDNGDTADKKPVISGCDAHSFEDLSEYLGKHIDSKGKYCTWIKASATFNGFRQIIYEPDSRVAIQPYEPDIKDRHNVIKKIIIKESGYTFGNQEIFFNRNLNTIIGGKSSGKSLLLYSLAKCVDPQQINRLSERFTLEDYHFENIEFEVEWADGEKDNLAIRDIDFDSETEKKHRITYIPQLYINHLAEKNSKDELNKLIDDILLQDQKYKNTKELFQQEIQNINSNIASLITSLNRLREEGLSATEERKGYGTIENYDAEINRLNREMAILRANTNMSEAELKRYHELLAALALADDKIAIANQNKAILKNIRIEIVAYYNSLFGNERSTPVINGSVQKLSSKLNDKYGMVAQVISNIKAGFIRQISSYDEEIVGLQLDVVVADAEHSRALIQDELKKYQDKLSKQSNLVKITEDIEKNRKARKYVEDLEKNIASIMEEYRISKTSIVQFMKARNDSYRKIMDYINDKKHNIGSEIELSCSLVYSIDDFQLYEQVDKRNANSNPYFKSLFIDDNCIDFEVLPDLFETLIRIENSVLIFKNKERNISLRHKMDISEIFDGLVFDGLKLNYNVTYRGDSLLKMSPGKKGTVLLILFLELSSATYPILIDQPEDNLDNRTIYDLLCRMMKNKKRERQIIIVTHNANLVVTTDSENTIVANQEGQEPDKEKYRYRFEYLNGPIELSFVDESQKGVLFQRGIKQHICDILEGGDEAFILRERKYRA
jgi:hypothetical protein